VISSMLTNIKSRIFKNSFPYSTCWQLLLATTIISSIYILVLNIFSK
jgi:hypothetical protein